MNTLTQQQTPGHSGVHYEPQRTPQGTLLVFACAWCPKSSYRKLKKNEAYSHGICGMHKKHLLNHLLAGRAEHMR